MSFFHKLTTHHAWASLFLRLAVGSIFLVHGIQKWELWSAVPSEAMSANMLNLFKFLSVVEPLGGAALVLGFLTQWAALGLSLVMLGAIYFKMFVWKTGFIAAGGVGWEYDLVLLAANLALLFSGAGMLALDKVLKKE